MCIRDRLERESEFWDIDRLIISAHNSFAGNLSLIHIFPIATNLATAELLILALGNGELEWRES